MGHPLSPPQALLEWVRTMEDAMVHSDIVMKDRSVIAQHAIAAETTLMKIPLIHTYGNSDVALALHLLKERHTTYKPYWDSLPRQIILPRDYPERFDKVLRGSPVLSHIQSMRHVLQTEYKKLAPDIVLEDFAYAMAVVSSRAFGVNNDKAAAMIPLLDMCNHTRGTSKNIGYEIHDEIVTVRSIVNIAAGASLVITYGAKPNAVLLCNYGFCIPNNLEPDGSSNDTLEFAASIFLRAGGKSYTYGPFIKALECVSSKTATPPGECTVEDDAGDDNDMNAFLNECDEDDDDDDYDVMYCGESDDDESMEEASPSLTKEVETLHQFIDCCDNKLHAYHLQGDSLRKRMDDFDYCAILVQSEQRILSFFRNAAVTIARKLQKLSCGGLSWDVVVGTKDRELLQGQMAELVHTYLQIRHPELAQ